MVDILTSAMMGEEGAAVKPLAGSEVRLGLLPDTSSLLLGLLVGLMVKLLPAMYKDLNLAGKRQRRATSSEEIEEAMISGMFEVPPPDLSRPDGESTLYRGLIQALTREAARSDLAAKRIEANVDRMRRPAVVVADFSRNVRQGEKKGQRRTSYERDIHSQYDKYQTSFEHSSSEGKGLKNNVGLGNLGKKSKYVLADFSPQRRAKTSLRSERSALNQDGSGGLIDRNRMDQIEDTIYVDQPKRRVRAGRAHALNRQAPATTTLDSTVQNEGGVLDVMNTIGNTFFRVGVAIAFFLL